VITTAPTNEKVNRGETRLGDDAPQREATMSARNTVTVTRGQIQFPNLCPVCLSAAPSSLQSIASDEGKFSGYYVFFTTRKHLVTQIAVCTDCARKEKQLQKYCRALVLLSLLVAVGVAIHFDLGRGSTIALGIALGAPGILLSELAGKPVRVGRYDDDTVEFSFKSSKYAELFRALNQSR
jgi:hypothetical protein